MTKKKLKKINKSSSVKQSSKSFVKKKKARVLSKEFTRHAKKILDLPSNYKNSELSDLIRHKRTGYIAGKTGIDDSEAEVLKSTAFANQYALGRLQNKVKRVRGKLYRDKKTGKFISYKNMKRRLQRIVKNEKIELFMTMYGVNKKRASEMYSEDKILFTYMLEIRGAYY